MGGLGTATATGPTCKVASLDSTFYKIEKGTLVSPFDLNLMTSSHHAANELGLGNNNDVSC